MSTHAAALLDTTYLLPFFAIQVRVAEVRQNLARLLASRQRLLYHPLSLVEAKWIVLGLERKGERELRARFAEGLDALLTDGRFAPSPLTSKPIEENADRLLDEGLQDYFDRMLASTAHSLEATFLTEDEELLNPKGPLGILTRLRMMSLGAFIRRSLDAGKA